ncbi:MAG: hypothetical protein ACK4NR_09390 [Micavibrio sp.]
MLWPDIWLRYCAASLRLWADLMEETCAPTPSRRRNGQIIHVDFRKEQSRGRH